MDFSKIKAEIKKQVEAQKAEILNEINQKIDRLSKSGKKADTELDLEVFHLQGPSVEDSAVGKLQKELNELKEKLGVESQKPERQYGGQITSPYSKIFHTLQVRLVKILLILLRTLVFAMMLMLMVGIFGFV